MYGLKIYITPEDVISRLPDEEKARFNQCVFTDVTRERDGSITIECTVLNDADPYAVQQHRQKYFREADQLFEAWKKLGYTDQEAIKLVEASGVYK